MNRIFSISNRSRSYKAARTALDGGANELRVVFSGRGAPSCELAIVWFFRQGRSIVVGAWCVKRQTVNSGLLRTLAASEPG